MRLWGGNNSRQASIKPIEIDKAQLTAAASSSRRVQFVGGMRRNRGGGMGMGTRGGMGTGGEEDGWRK